MMHTCQLGVTSTLHNQPSFLRSESTTFSPGQISILVKILPCQGKKMQLNWNIYFLFSFILQQKKSSKLAINRISNKIFAKWAQKIMMTLLLLSPFVLSQKYSKQSYLSVALFDVNYFQTCAQNKKHFRVHVFSYTEEQ